MELRLFDLGGTLVDSAWSKKEALLRFAAAKGVVLAPAELRARLEHFPVARVRTSALMAWLKDNSNYEPAPDDRQRFLEIEQGLEMHLVPGVSVYLQALADQDIQCGLVTNAGTEWLSFTIERTPLGRFFDTSNIFGRQKHEPKKPDPTTYLRAIERYTPDVVVAYEDTPWGIEAARRAEVNIVIGLASSEHHSERLLLDAGADAVFRDYIQLPVHPWQGAMAGGHGRATGARSDTWS